MRRRTLYYSREEFKVIGFIDSIGTQHNSLTLANRNPIRELCPIHDLWHDHKIDSYVNYDLRDGRPVIFVYSLKSGPDGLEYNPKLSRKSLIEFCYFHFALIFL